MTSRPQPKPVAPDGARDRPHPRLEVRDYDHVDARQLVAALYDEQVERYGYADPAEADPAAFRPPVGIFLVAYIGGAPVACGGLRTYESATRTVEIKKMYTLPERRGQGIGRQIIAALEEYARVAGADRVILETGVRNVAALKLYTGVGFTPTERYVDGRDPDINRAFSKSLRLLGS
jgi:GNAT superfamily N-acetyltransferase